MSCCQPNFVGIKSKHLVQAQEHGPLREKKDKYPSVSAASREIINQVSERPAQAKEVVANSNLYFPKWIKTRRESFSPSALHILMLSNGIWGTRPTSPTTWAKEQKCIFSQKSKKEWFKVPQVLVVSWRPCLTLAQPVPRAHGRERNDGWVGIVSTLVPLLSPLWNSHGKDVLCGPSFPTKWGARGVISVLLKLEQMDK